MRKGEEREEGEEEGKVGGEAGRKCGSEGAGGAGGEGGQRRGAESANFRFEGIVGSSHGLMQAPHLSAAPAPALASRPRVPRPRSSPAGDGGGPATMVSAGELGGGADPGGCVRAPSPSTCRSGPGARPVGEQPRSAPRSPTLPSRPRPGTPGRQLGSLAATERRCFIHSTVFAGRSVCARRGAGRRRRGDPVEPWLLEAYLLGGG